MPVCCRPERAFRVRENGGDNDVNIGPLDPLCGHSAANTLAVLVGVIFWFDLDF